MSDTVGENSRVTLHFAVLLDTGEEVDTTRRGQPATFEVGDGNLLPGFEQVLMGMRAGDDAQIELTPEQAFGLNLIIFSILVENVSLFSQFATVLSFTHFRGLLKNTSNIIAWTSKDEQLHANAGIYIFNQIVKENPGWLTDKYQDAIYNTVRRSIEQEKRILDWIFEAGELDHLSKAQLLNFMKHRINSSLQRIGLQAVFTIDQELLRQMNWFEEEVFANTLDDFFAKRPVEYSKHNQSFTADDLF